MIQSSSVTVLTTLERRPLFMEVFGEDAHYVLDPMRTNPLELQLSNISAVGGSLTVLDEDHFITSDALFGGLRRYLDSTETSKGTRIVVVCGEREAGDSRLRDLTTYLGIYDVLWAEHSQTLSRELSKVATRPNKRTDVLDLMRPSPSPARTDFERISWHEPQVLQVESEQGKSFTIKINIEAA